MALQLLLSDKELDFDHSYTSTQDSAVADYTDSSPSDPISQQMSSNSTPSLGIFSTGCSMSVQSDTTTSTHHELSCFNNDLTFLENLSVITDSMENDMIVRQNMESSNLIIDHSSPSSLTTESPTSLSPSPNHYFMTSDCFSDYYLKNYFTQESESSLSSPTSSETSATGSFFTGDISDFHHNAMYPESLVELNKESFFYKDNLTEGDTISNEVTSPQDVDYSSHVDLVNSVNPFPKEFIQFGSESEECFANIQGHWYNYDPQDKNIIDDAVCNDNKKAISKCTSSTHTEHKKGQRSERLWEFIRGLLLNRKFNPSYAEWVDRRNGLFRFNNSKAVAQLWGSRKNNENMTYEKLSRAMRYYYSRKILQPVIGKKLVYKFGPNSYGW